MKKTNLRIFVTTSHISTVFMTMLAQETRQETDRDVLLIDTGYRRPELIRLIEETAAFHNWELFSNFSDSASADHSFEPGWRKRMTRSLKGLPLIRIFYKKALNRFLHAKDAKYKSKLSGFFADWLMNVNTTEIITMTQTYLNQPLRQLFPDAHIRYTEHGIGDYYFVFEHDYTHEELICVFAEPYKKYLERNSIGTNWVKQLPGIEKFPALALQLFEKHSSTINSASLPTPQKPVVFVLLESLDIYNVADNFWTDYLRHFLSDIHEPSQYHYILKPHPMHSRHSMDKTDHYFRESGLDYTLLRNDEWSSCSAEVLFAKWADQTKHVYCLFSSAGFYLSQLYANKGITFHCSTDFLSRYISNAPPQFLKAFTEIRPIIDEVFAEKCAKY